METKHTHTHTHTHTLGGKKIEKNKRNRWTVDSETSSWSVAARTCLWFSLAMLTPLTSTMRSPGKRPAACAGEPASTLPMNWPWRTLPACRLKPNPVKSARLAMRQRRGAGALFAGVGVAISHAHTLTHTHTRKDADTDTHTRRRWRKQEEEERSQRRTRERWPACVRPPTVLDADWRSRRPDAGSPSRCHGTALDFASPPPPPPQLNSPQRNPQRMTCLRITTAHLCWSHTHTHTHTQRKTQ